MRLNDVICDICNKTCRWMATKESSAEYAILSVRGDRWGYGSCFDGEEHELHICADCYEDMPEPWRGKVRRQDHSGYNLAGVGLDTVLKTEEYDMEEYARKEAQYDSYVTQITEEIQKSPERVEKILKYYMPHIGNI